MEADSNNNSFLLPQAAALLNMYRRSKRGDCINHNTTKAVHDILVLISQVSLANVKIYTASSGAKFPYTFVDLKEILYDILNKPNAYSAFKNVNLDFYNGFELNQTPSINDVRCKREFILSPIPWNTRQGSWFEYAEFPIRNILRMIPHAIAIFEDKKCLLDYRIYSLGYPTHEVGFITPSYKRELQIDKFSGLSRPSYELVSEVISEMPANGSSVILCGISLGSAVAAEIGSMLLDQRLAKPVLESRPGLSPLSNPAPGMKNQNFNGPLLTVAMYSPAVVNISKQALWRRRISLAFGLSIEALARLLTNPTFRQFVVRRRRFELFTRELLQQRSIPVNLDSRQKILKAECLRIYRNLAVEGTDVPKDSRMALQLVGACDPLAYTLRDKKKLREANRKNVFIVRSQGAASGNWIRRDKTIAKNWLPGRRKTLLKMGHLVPFARKSVVAIFDRAAYAVMKQRERDQSRDQLPKEFGG